VVGAALGAVAGPATVNAQPLLTLVLEWDNVHFSDEPRARLVLERLARELESVAKPVELIFAFDGADGDAAPLRRLLDETLSAEGVEPVYLAAPGKRYYELKNAGAAQARGDLLVFLDSDVVPEPGWLGRLVAPFADPDVQVVGGNAYIEPRGIWGKTFALAWFFPVRSDDDRLEPATSFFANNVAFRRATFVRFPFPEAAGTSRGSCVLLARTLRAHGIAIRRATGAQVSHPPPRGGRSVIVRALAQGRDRALLDKQDPVARPTLRRFVADRRRVGLSLAELPVALGLAALYYALAVVGAVATRLLPRLMTRRFRI
jgi:glycosyltransferase involved in cell wall biosynthesis